jgi:phosphate starvation-inducible PhoH-like protein
LPTKTLQFPSGRQLAQLYANDEANLALAEQKLGARIVTRDDWLRLEGPDEAVARTEEFLQLLEQGRAQGLALRTADFHRLLATYLGTDGPARLRALFSEPVQIGTAKRTIVPKTIGQKLYLQAMQRNPVVFGIGPAGTGKTYLAMAAAITALMKNQVQRVILTRPAVEAGENLGFLPGDLREKILPYLRPLYDAMHDLLSPEDAAKLAEKGIIEIAPLAYMRGRTLSNAFIVLDEAQNTTPEQMMMFLTRLGDESRMVVTGDVTQIDLPRTKSSGLLQAPRILHGIAGIEVHHFSGADVVRHPLVQRIIEAYDRAKASPADTARPGHPPPA